MDAPSMSSATSSSATSASTSTGSAPTSAEQALAALAGLSFNNPLYFTRGVAFNVYSFISGISPSYCPTDVLSGLLAIVLADLGPQLILGPPLWSTFPIKGSVKGGVLALEPSFYGTFSQNVPWWQMPDGTLIPVSCIAGYFTHGLPPAAALANARAEIAGDVAATAASLGD